MWCLLNREEISRRKKVIDYPNRIMRHLYRNLRHFVLHHSFPKDCACLLDSEVCQHIVTNLHDPIVNLDAAFPFDHARLDYSFNRKTVTVRIITKGNTCRKKDDNFIKYLIVRKVVEALVRFLLSFLKVKIRRAKTVC